MCIEFLRSQKQHTPWNFPQRKRGENFAANILAESPNLPKAHQANITNASSNILSTKGSIKVNPLESVDLEANLTKRVSSMSNPDLRNIFKKAETENELSPLDLMFKAAAMGQEQPAVVGCQAYVQQQQIVADSSVDSPNKQIDTENDLKKVPSAPDLDNTAENVATVEPLVPKQTP